MHNFWKVMFVFAAAGLILACSIASAPVTAPTQQNFATIVAGTIRAITAAAPTNSLQATSMIRLGITATPATQGASVSYNQVSFIIPHGLANGTTNTITTGIEFPYINPSAGDMPQHIKIVLDGYPIPGTSLDPQITVFKSSEYAQYADLTQQTISALQNLQYAQGQPLPGGLPSGQFDAQGQAVNFADGHGIRYLTQFDESPLPVNNHELIYYFHGLTNDSQYYVQAILPLQASFLALDENPNSPLPANGIPFHADPSYFNTIAQQLNTTPPNQFSPSLTSLDALVQSITVKP